MPEFYTCSWKRFLRTQHPFNLFSRPNFQHSAVPFDNLVSLKGADFFPKVVTSESLANKGHSWMEELFLWWENADLSPMAKILTARFLGQSTPAKAHKITDWLDWGRKAHMVQAAASTHFPNTRLSFSWSLVQEYGPQELAQSIVQPQSVNY